MTLALSLPREAPARATDAGAVHDAPPLRGTGAPRSRGGDGRPGVSHRGVGLMRVPQGRGRVLGLGHGRFTGQGQVRAEPDREAARWRGTDGALQLAFRAQERRHLRAADRGHGPGALQEESVEQLKRSMRWIGLDWDEGPEAGGPHTPYRQTERFDLYREAARK